MAASDKPTNNTALYQSYYNPIADEVNKYADELISQAGGDYDFAAKYLEKAYREAVGLSDSSRSQFLMDVASKLEEKIGTIAYDHQTNTYRIKEDAATQRERVKTSTDRALKRLDEDEVLAKRANTMQDEADRASLDASLNSRGLVSAPRDKAVGLQGKTINDQEIGLADRRTALENSINRQREDITTSNQDTLTDIDRAESRGIEDSTTAARRGLFGTQMTYDQGIGSASRVLAQARQQAEAARRSGLNQAKVYANYYAQGTL